MTTPAPQASQVKHPWTATPRTGFAVFVGFCSLRPYVLEAGGVDASAGWAAQVLGVTAGVTRVMTLPQVEVFLRQFASFLAAEPRGHAD